MGKRKIILLCLAAFLLAVYITQIVLGSKNTIQTLSLDSDSLKEITLSSKESGEITLKKDAEGWKVGKYKANESKVNQVLEELKSIKILDTVSSSASDISRYGLNEESVIKVKASSSEKLLRSLEIGKTSATGSQTYIRYDGAKAVCLASGSLASLFSSTAEQFRDNGVYSFASADIEKVVLHSSEGSFSLTRLPSSSDDDVSEWAFVGDDGTIDSEHKADSAKVSSWVSSIAILNASEWTSESDKTPLEAETTLEISAKEKKVSVKLSKKGDDEKYTAECSETPYRFKLTSYSGSNLIKSRSELESQ